MPWIPTRLDLWESRRGLPLEGVAARRKEVHASHEDVAVYAQRGPDRFTFQGHLGLAPRWLYEAMTPSEER